MQYDFFDVLSFYLSDDRTLHLIPLSVITC